MCQTVRRLTREDLGSEGLLTLVREAAGQPEAQIRRILAEELPAMVVLGTGPQGRPFSFAACTVHPDHVELEYLAVADSLRGRGVGRRLLAAVARLGSPVVAETDDDAVGFYRRLGFRVTAATEDPRWPGTTRYRCVLEHGLPLRQHGEAHPATTGRCRSGTVRMARPGRPVGADGDGHLFHGEDEVARQPAGACGDGAPAGGATGRGDGADAPGRSADGGPGTDGPAGSLGGDALGDDVPGWVGELVVLAEHVRAVLRAEAPPSACGAVALAAAAWAGVPGLPWLAWACALGAGGLALRHAWPPPGSSLRAGAWTGVVLLVLDLTMTLWALVLLAGLRLAGASQPLLTVAACAVSGTVAGLAALLVSGLTGARGAGRHGVRGVPRPGSSGNQGAVARPGSPGPGQPGGSGGSTSRRARSGACGPAGPGSAGRLAFSVSPVSPVSPVSAVLTVAGAVLVGGCVVWLLGTHLDWWWVGGAALLTELGGALVVRMGAWAQRRTGGRG